MIFRYILLSLSTSLMFLYTDALAQDKSFEIDTNRISDIEIEDHFNKIGDLFTSERPNMELIYNYEKLQNM